MPRNKSWTVSLLVLNLSHKMGLEDNETRKSQRENQWSTNLPGRDFFPALLYSVLLKTLLVFSGP